MNSRMQGDILFLPLRESAHQRLLENSGHWPECLHSLEPYELGCVLLIGRLPASLISGRKLCERTLAACLAICEDTRQKNLTASLVSGIERQISWNQFLSGSRLMPTLGIRLIKDDITLPEALVAGREQWVYQLQQLCRDDASRHLLQVPYRERSITLTDEQSRMFAEIKSQPDEHLNIHGFAGTGKSTLLKTLLELFKRGGGRLLIIASRQQQLRALSISTKGVRNIHLCTFGDLARLAIPKDLTSAINRNLLRHANSGALLQDDEIIRQLGVSNANKYQTEQFVRAIRNTVFVYCMSGDRQISDKHIPVAYSAGFDITTRRVIVDCAEKLWRIILAPPGSDLRPQVRDYHRIKWAALNGWSVPENYTHILVDECHDLPKPVQQILLRSPQAQITLGDDYQNLKGHSRRRANDVRERQMFRSIRSGKEIETIINPIIAAHPRSLNAGFKGNRDRHLSISYYKEAAIPALPALILVSDRWSLLEWLQRLTSSGIKPAVLADDKDLNTFVTDCIELQAGNNKARHGVLFRYPSWDAVARNYESNTSFLRVNRLLEKGFTHSNWHHTRQSTTGRIYRSAGYGISLIDNIRNEEFDCVMLAPDIIEMTSRVSRAVACAHIYVAATRARRQLIVPEALRDWIESTGGVQNQ